jgi:hypothetical protein
MRKSLLTLAAVLSVGLSLVALYKFNYRSNVSDGQNSIRDTAYNSPNKLTEIKTHDQSKSFTPNRDYKYIQNFVSTAKNPSDALWALYSLFGDPIYLSQLRDRVSKEPEASVLLAIDACTNTLGEVNFSKPEHFQKSVEYLREGLKHFPNDFLLNALLAGAEYRINDINKAIQHLETAISLKANGAGQQERRNMIRQYLLDNKTDELLAWTEAYRLESKTEYGMHMLLSGTSFIPDEVKDRPIEYRVQLANKLLEFNELLAPNNSSTGSNISTVVTNNEYTALRILPPDALYDEKISVAERLQQLDANKLIERNNLVNNFVGKSNDAIKLQFEKLRNQNGELAYQYIESLINDSKKTKN